MNRRSWIALAALAAVVVALGLIRGGAGSEAAPAHRTDTGRPAILDFGRGTCVACKKMMPVLDEVREAFRGVVDVRYHDLADEVSAARARELGVRLIPTQVFLTAGGEEVWRHEGFLPREEIEQKLVELGWISSR